METVKLDFPDRDLYILKDGDWRGYRSTPCAKEPETVEWIRSFDEGSVLWDVGASVGSYSLIAAALGHVVVAFEPFALSYGYLTHNIWLNKGCLVLPYPIGLKSESGFGNLLIEASNSVPGAASHNRTGATFAHGQPYVGYSVDDFADAEMHGYVPNHVKIDVDGAELGVIEGGRTLWKQVDSIMVESEPPTVDNITVILQGAGLELVDSWKRLGDTRQHNYLYSRSKL